MKRLGQQRTVKALDTQAVLTEQPLKFLPHPTELNLAHYRHTKRRYEKVQSFFGNGANTGHG